MKRIFHYIPAVLVGICLCLGVWMLIFGIGDALERSRLEENYETTEGYFSDYALYSEGGYDSIRHRHTTSTYRLIYAYIVGGVSYTVSTDYGTGIIPALGETRTVYYNPADPGTALLGGESGSHLLIFIGAMFTAVALAFILGWLYLTDRLPKLHIELMDLIMGTITAAFGGGFLYFMRGAFPLLMVIPLMLIAAGIWLIIRGIFFPGKK